MKFQNYSARNHSTPKSSPDPRSKRYKSLHLLRDINIFLILFFFSTFFSYLFFNGNAFWRDLRYALFLNSPFASADLRNGEIIDVPNTGSRSGATGSGTGRTGSGAAPVSASGFSLVMPEINTSAPIVIPESNSKSAILASLETGVGLYPGSVMPGSDGRAVLLGHSSKASWYRGNYAYVFTLLTRLDPPDEFYITYNGKKYTYEVFAHRTLSKKDTDNLLSGPTDGSEVDLVTCYPIGGASQRTVIQGKLVKTEAI
jgi:LPXTG-site transpeptidase (sortase) family protein